MLLQDDLTPDNVTASAFQKHDRSKGEFNPKLQNTDRDNLNVYSETDWWLKWLAFMWFNML